MKYVPSAFESFPEANSISSFKTPSADSQHMTDWVKERFDHIFKHPDMVKRSFKVCTSISSSDPLKVRSASFYQQCMEKVLSDLEVDIEEREDNLSLIIVED